MTVKSLIVGVQLWEALRRRGIVMTKSSNCEEESPLEITAFKKRGGKNWLVCRLEYKHTILLRQWQNGKENSLTSVKSTDV